MNQPLIRRAVMTTFALFALLSLLLVSGCKTTGIGRCTPPSGHNLQSAVAQAKSDLSGRCGDAFESYFSALLTIAEQDPAPENRETFSQLLLWSNHQGLISKARAQELYNRYFNLKFVAMKGDFSNCSATCPNISQVMLSMEQELVAKEQGLLKICRDNDGYQRADRLVKETELVLTATCNACRAE